MLGKLWRYCIFLSFLVSFSAFGDSIIFPAGATEIVPGEVQSYFVPLAASGYFSMSIVPQKIALEVKIFDPAGRELRYAPPFERKSSVSIAVDVSGSYRIDVIGSKSVASKGGSYEISQVKIWDKKTRLNPPADVDLLSPTIQNLRQEIKRNGNAAVTHFLNDLSIRGSPMVETIADDKLNRLVTFIWKGDRQTENAVILIWPYSIFHQDQYRMKRLEATDLWYKSLPIPKDARFVYSLGINIPEATSDAAHDVIMASFREDPLNSRGRTEDPAFFDHPSKFHRQSILEMPDAPPQPWTQSSLKVPKGKVERLHLRSEVLGTNHPIAVYVPPGFPPVGEPSSLLIVFDKLEYLSYIPTPIILDNLIAEKKIRPTVAVFIDFPEPRYDVRARELTCNSEFSKFLSQELLPWAQKNYHVTDDPRRIILAGSSFGGLAATCAGLHQPRFFQNILSQSGSFWWTQDFLPQEFGEHPPALDPDRELNDVAQMFLKERKLPLHFFMEAGANEIDLSGHGGYLLLPGRHLRDILKAKGYDVHWQEFRGGHDYLSWRGSLADGLIFLQEGK